MVRYIVRRLIQSIPLLLGVSVIGFLLMHLSPGGPMAMYAMNPNMTADNLEHLKKIFGLDQPLHIQYFKWVTGMISGNWGNSYRDGRAVITIVFDRIPATLELMSASFIIAVLLGLLVGTLGAIRRYSIFDYLATTGAMVALSIPTFWFGLMVIFVMAVQLGWLPSGGIASMGMDFSLVDRLRHLIAPAIVLGLVMVATWSRYTRSSMLEVIEQDYVRTARAKGLKERTLLLRHALRNAIIPLITLGGLQLPWIFSGALVTESVFTWPGMGRLFVDSLAYRDYPVLMAILMFTSLLVVLGNLMADVLCAVADPRIRLG